MYSVKVERDSINSRSERLTSFVIRMPRVVLAEILTHRVTSESWGEDFYLCERTADRETSKNSASSRAIPFQRMVDSIRSDPYMPMWSLQQKGMQGELNNDADKKARADIVWMDHLEESIHAAGELHKLGIHKQDCNRLLEPWAWVTQIVTSSAWDNFFALRCHEAAFPPFRKLARMMFLARRKSTPRKLEAGEWHLPFVDPEEEKKLNWIPDINLMKTDLEKAIVEIPDLIKYSAARAAWLSYENHDKDGSHDTMLKTFNRLITDRPCHASPVEHQATPMHPAWQATWPSLRSNLTGYLQARKLIPYECVYRYEPTDEQIASWGEG